MARPPNKVQNKAINSLITKISKLETLYGSRSLRLACNRYATMKRDEERLEKDIVRMTKELGQLKQKKKA